MRTSRFVTSRISAASHRATEASVESTSRPMAPFLIVDECLIVFAVQVFDLILLI